MNKISAYPSVYLAARYSRKQEMITYREDLRKLGFRVTSRWLDAVESSESGEVYDIPDNKEEYSRCADVDTVDIESADVLIAFTEAPNTNLEGSGRGGRHVELGMALSLGMVVFIVGPRENIFCWSPKVDGVFTDFPSLYTHIQERLAVVTGLWSDMNKGIVDRDIIEGIDIPTRNVILGVFEYLASEFHLNAKSHGFWDDIEEIERVVPEHLRDRVHIMMIAEKIALFHSEVSECLEAVRKPGLVMDKHCPEFTSLEVEIADEFIRMLEFACHEKLRIGSAMIAKHNYNKSRPFKHGKNS